ncbi:MULTISPECIES: PPOX class F420-dependent oxidoreductase [unclassified Streptomyces]|uniref:PPOX class F420-dependent oxidoreductase n=1 Tax=unclassified Streptomyces TaxID=2593676 RepID=UPI0010119F92|nr:MULTISPECIES: PPOX class F420-dependent oxidoreductase [unclassified Streptomyces]NJA60461.1 PPOX class F420-dependent oxidoreductase [Streptomyces sp. NEAU-H3]
MSVPAELAAAKYVSLVTYRRSGVAVATPVWLAVDGERLVAWSDAHAGKVKRLRHTSRVSVRACDVRGRIAAGAGTYEGTGRVLDEAEGRAARRALARKYVLVRLTDLMRRVVPRTNRPGVALAVEFPAGA